MAGEGAKRSGRGEHIGEAPPGSRRARQEVANTLRRAFGLGKALSTGTVRTEPIIDI